MSTIRCPHCQKEFSVSEADYEAIASQIRTLEFTRELAERKEELHQQLKLAVEKARLEEQLRVSGLLSAKAQEILELQQQQNAQKEKYEILLKQSEEQVSLYKDLKAKMSTKMLGETLEQHCEIAFEQVRAIGFQSAQFGKDNDSRTGSKGDYIFRDFDETGMEYISIMFEMKNEMETTATKHRNRDFYRELDKDRREKKCEYAVLVSLLEKGNDYFDAGIVDVSHEYPKMYVIRPQCFIPLITLLRNMARTTLSCKQEMEHMRQQQADVEQFEANLTAFKEDIADKYRLGQDKLDDAIAQIQKAIDALEKTKADLEGAKDKLRLADKKAAKVTIRSLSKGAPGIMQLFDTLKE